MGCSSIPCLEDYAYLFSIYANPEAYKAAKIREEINKKITLKTASFTNAKVFSKEPFIRDFSPDTDKKQNIELYI